MQTADSLMICDRMMHIGGLFLCSSLFSRGRGLHSDLAKAGRFATPANVILARATPKMCMKAWAFAYSGPNLTGI